MDIKPCDADGTVWAILIRNTGVSNNELINVRASNDHGYDMYLTGDNVVGDRLKVDCWRCTTGTYQNWLPS